MSSPLRLNAFCLLLERLLRYVRVQQTPKSPRPREEGVRHKRASVFSRWKHLSGIVDRAGTAHQLYDTTRTLALQ